MAVGIIESFELIHKYASKKTASGEPYMTQDEILFAAEAYRRKGCRLIKTTLTKEEIGRILEIGKRIKNQIGK